MRSAGALPSRIAAMMRGDRKARGASRRMCRSPNDSRLAILVKEATRPSRITQTNIGSSLVEIKQRGAAGAECGWRDEGERISA